MDDAGRSCVYPRVVQDPAGGLPATEAALKPIDGIVTVLVFLLGLLSVLGLDGRQSDAPLLGVLLTVATSLPFLWRRRWPIAVLALAELVFLVFLVIGSGLRVTGPSGPAMVVRSTPSPPGGPGVFPCPPPRHS